MAEKKEKKTVEELLEEYNTTGKRPRKNQFSFDDMETYCLSINDNEWLDTMYLAKVHVQGGIPLPLSKTDLDEIRTIFVDTYFPKIEFTTVKEPTEKEKKAIEKFEAIKKRASKK